MPAARTRRAARESGEEFFGGVLKYHMFSYFLKDGALGEEGRAVARAGEDRVCGGAEEACEALFRRRAPGRASKQRAARASPMAHRRERNRLGGFFSQKKTVCGCVCAGRGPSKQFGSPVRDMCAVHTPTLIHHE